MWRFPRRVHGHLTRRVNKTPTLIGEHKNVCLHCQVRYYAATPIPPAAGGGVLRLVLGLFGASAVVGGGAVAYAKYDHPFRDLVEKNVPYSDMVLGYILGEREDEKEQQKSANVTPLSPQQIKEKAIQSGLVQKKLEREAQQKLESQSSPSTSPVSPPAPTQTSTKATPPAKEEKVIPTSSKQQTSVPEKKTADVNAEINRRIVSQSAASAVENSAVESLVEDTVKDLNTALAMALTAYRSAATAIKNHNDKLQKALDVSQGENQDEAWQAVNSSASNKSSAVAEAENKGAKVREVIRKVKTVVDEGRKSKVTATNESLVTAEEVINRAIYELQKAESEVTVVQSEAKILTEYKNLVEQGKEQFKKELQSLLPEVKVGEKGKKLSEDELNYLIAHAHRKVEQLQKQLAMQQAGEKQRVQQSLDTQRKEYDSIVNSRLGAELDRQQRELQIAYQRKFNDLNEEFENELLQQLRRQAAAHSEHLRDMLHGQRKELEFEYENLVDDRITAARHEFQREIAGSLGRLKGIETGLTSRAELDRATRKAQHLWVACQALKHSIRVGHPGTKSWEAQRKPLVNEIAAIKKAADSEDKFVQGVLQSVNEEAVLRGVFTEDAIKDRFFRVDSVCRRVAMIDKDNSSLFRYALSYLQSLLILSNLHLPEAERADEPINVDQLNTFDVLDRARWYIDRDNLEQALRYMNLLGGAPKKVASDWVKETRLLLEVRQAADALLSRAAAIEVQAVQ